MLLALPEDWLRRDLRIAQLCYRTVALSWATLEVPSSVGKGVRDWSRRSLAVLFLCGPRRDCGTEASQAVRFAD